MVRLPWALPSHEIISSPPITLDMLSNVGPRYYEPGRKTTKEIQMLPAFLLEHSFPIYLNDLRETTIK